MSRGTCAFTYKGCMQAARLVGELRYLRQMLDSMKRMITGQGLEEESEETGSSGKTGRNGGEGKARTREDTRQHLD